MVEDVATMPLPQLLGDSDGVGATDASNGNSKYEASLRAPVMPHSLTHSLPRDPL